MDEKKRMLKVIYGTQESSLDYIKRFSMCDCITLYMPQTYTAMGAGTDLFNKLFVTGEKCVYPYANNLPKDEEKKFRPIAYKIPNKIDTFIWSPFHDALSTYWNLGNEVKYSFVYKGAFLQKLGLAKKVERPTQQEVIKMLQVMDEKINRLWGDNVNKILLFYEDSRLRDGPAKTRLHKYREMTLKTLDWPLATFNLTDMDAIDKADFEADTANYKKWSGWQHYSPKTREVIYNKIAELEK